MSRDGRERPLKWHSTAQRPALALLIALLAAVSCGHDRVRGSADSTAVGAPAGASTGTDTAGEHARVIAMAAYGDSTPKYGPGQYDLVRVRGRPLVDDSAEARREVEGAWKWIALDTAATADDSTELLERYIARDRTGDWSNLLAHAASEDDSTEVLTNFLEASSCTKWLVSGTVQLAADGHFVETHLVRQYCHGNPPRFASWNEESKDSLQFCMRVGQPVRSTIHHVSCVAGTYQNRWRNFRHVGDTLQLGQPCHGRSTYMLRGSVPAVAPARSGSLINYNGTC